MKINYLFAVHVLMKASHSYVTLILININLVYINAGCFRRTKGLSICIIILYFKCDQVSRE